MKFCKVSYNNLYCIKISSDGKPICNLKLKKNEINQIGQIFVSQITFMHNIYIFLDLRKQIFETIVQAKYNNPEKRML